MDLPLQGTHEDQAGMHKERENTKHAHRLKIERAHPLDSKKCEDMIPKHHENGIGAQKVQVRRLRSPWQARCS